MRIAQVAPLWLSVPPHTYGGAELMVHLLAEELVKRGHEVTLFASGDSRTNARLIPVCQQSVTEAMLKGEAYEYQHYTSASAAEVLRRRESFDIVHFHLGCEYLPFGALLEKTKALFTIHIPFSIDDQWCLRRCPDLAVAAISESQMAPVRQHGLNMRVIHHGCDFGRYKFSANPGSYLAFLGRMGRQKSPVDAIRIAAGAGLPIVLAGAPQNSDEAQYFASEVKPLIDGKNVTYIGLVDHDQKVELLRNAAALLFPIQGEEAFGIAMIEAMACGTPVVAWERASVTEVVDFGKTGYYGDSVASLVSLVPLALLLDRKQVRQHALERFSHERMVDRYLEMYAWIAKRPTSN